MEMGVNKCNILSQVTLSGKGASWLRFLVESITILPIVRGININEVIASVGNEEGQARQWGESCSRSLYFRQSVQNSLSVLVRVPLNIHLRDHTVHFQPWFLRVVISSSRRCWESVKLALSMMFPGSPFIFRLPG